MTFATLLVLLAVFGSKVELGGVSDAVFVIVPTVPFTWVWIWNVAVTPAGIVAVEQTTVFVAFVRTHCGDKNCTTIFL